MNIAQSAIILIYYLNNAIQICQVQWLMEDMKLIQNTERFWKDFAKLFSFYLFKSHIWKEH